jgi:hypothetical protein
MEGPRRRESPSVAAGAAAVGGLLAFIGVYLGWFLISAGEARGITDGAADWTGLMAAIAGLAALLGGAAAMMFKDGAVSAFGAGLAAVGGVFAAAGALIALLRLDAIAAEIARAPASGSAAVGLLVSLLGGLVAMLGGWQAQRRR